MRWQIPDSQCVWSQSRQRRSPRRIADRLLTVSLLEQRPARCELVDIGRSNMFVAVAAQFNPQIIHRDEQHIGLRRTLLVSLDQRREQWHKTEYYENTVHCLLPFVLWCSVFIRALNFLSKFLIAARISGQCIDQVDRFAHIDTRRGFLIMRLPFTLNQTIYQLDPAHCPITRVVECRERFGESVFNMGRGCNRCVFRV